LFEFCEENIKTVQVGAVVAAAQLEDSYGEK